MLCKVSVVFSNVRNCFFSAGRNESISEYASGRTTTLSRIHCTQATAIAALTATGNRFTFVLDVFWPKPSFRLRSHMGKHFQNTLYTWRIRHCLPREKYQLMQPDVWLANEISIVGNRPYYRDRLT